MERMPGELGQEGGDKRVRTLGRVYGSCGDEVEETEGEVLSVEANPLEG
jgi:hypothetical protein